MDTVTEAIVWTARIHTLAANGVDTAHLASPTDVEAAEAVAAAEDVPGWCTEWDSAKGAVVYKNRNTGLEVTCAADAQRVDALAHHGIDITCTSDINIAEMVVAAEEPPSGWKKVWNSAKGSVVYKNKRTKVKVASAAEARKCDDDSVLKQTQQLAEAAIADMLARAPDPDEIGRAYFAATEQWVKEWESADMQESHFLESVMGQRGVGPDNEASADGLDGGTPGGMAGERAATQWYCAGCGASNVIGAHVATPLRIVLCSACNPKCSGPGGGRVRYRRVCRSKTPGQHDGGRVGGAATTRNLHGLTAPIPNIVYNLMFVRAAVELEGAPDVLEGLAEWGKVWDMRRRTVCYVHTTSGECVSCLQEVHVNITVRTLTGESTSLRVALADSIAAVKAIIQYKTGTPTGQQRLVFAGKQLEDNTHTLHDYAIPQDATLHLVRRTTPSAPTLLYPKDANTAYTFPVVSTCPKHYAKEFLDSLKLFDGRFNRDQDKCYCSECYTSNSVLHTEGPHPYIIPRGWVRFGLNVQGRPQVEDPEERFFETWCVAYHGVTSVDVLKSVLKCGQLMKPGDKLLDGTKLFSTKCAGRQDNVFYTSPTVRYAGLKFYATPMKWRGDTMRASIVLQCRQKPGSFQQQGQTMGFTQEDLVKYRPHADPATIEWMSDTNVAAVPYGLLVRVWEEGADDESEAYASPVDPKVCVNVTVRTPTGETTVLSVELADSIAVVKALIESKIGTPAGQQRLSFAGKQLEDNTHTLHDYAIPQDATLQLDLNSRSRTTPSAPPLRNYRERLNLNY